MVTGPTDTGSLAVLRLWPIRIRIGNDDTPVWIGNVSWLYAKETPLLLTILKTGTDFDAPLGQLRRSLRPELEVVAQQRTVKDLPEKVIWDGTVLLVSE